MSQYSPFFNRWLSQIGPDQIISIIADMAGSSAVFVIDAEGKILFWSRGAEKLLGITAEQALGHQCVKALNYQDNQNDPCGLAEQGSIKAKMVKLKTAGGQVLSCYRTARAFFDAQGNFAGAIEFLQPQAEVAAVPSLLAANESFHGILSRDPTMLEAIKVIRNVAETDATVLIRGESGTGKELVAHALHLESQRHSQPFLAINCAALSPSLLESELFGHVKGAFTGAVKSHNGLFQRANSGTLFLDEIAELPFELQAKLLRALQERKFIPVGGDAEITMDVRIIAATHRSLREAVKAGHFREDLMYRLRVVPIFLPPLRERRQDISLLLWHQIGQHNLRGPRQINSIAPEAMRRLLDYQWPGNVRELINVVEYAFAVGRGNELSLDDLPPEFRETALPNLSPPAGRNTAHTDEAALIEQALQTYHGHMDEAARSIGMSRATFWRKRKKYGL
ncbi:MAG: sigma-54-dependent Fis family transcriptional regulator [Methylobacter sp.]|nr:MAG: sigma-54-dependent Fis family transcriptional regulator [Methylobacter sp.]